MLSGSAGYGLHSSALAPGKQIKIETRRSCTTSPAPFATVLLALYLFNYALNTTIAKLLLPRGDASADAALLIAAAYVIQVQSAAWYVRLGDRVFGLHPS